MSMIGDRYSLTLTSSERRAFDLVGDRYASGQIADVLKENLPADSEWTADGDITFAFPEMAAWRIAELAAGDGRLFPCFSADLRDKLNAFIDAIV